MIDVLAASNIPKEYACPLPKVWFTKTVCFDCILTLYIIVQGKYWVKNFQLDSKKTVPWAPEGLWRGEVFIFDPTDKEILQIDATARVEGSVIG